MIFTTQDATAFVVAFALLLASVASLLVIRRILGHTHGATKIAILRTLESYAREAVAGAASLSESLLADIDKTLTTADKKAIADQFYALLPPVIHAGTVLLPIGLVKRFVSQAEWESLVQQAVDDLDVKVRANESWLASKVAALIAPPVAPIVSEVPVVVATALVTSAVVHGAENVSSLFDQLTAEAARRSITQSLPPVTTIPPQG